MCILVLATCCCSELSVLHVIGHGLLFCNIWMLLPCSCLRLTAALQHLLPNQQIAHHAVGPRADHMRRQGWCTTMN